MEDQRTELENQQNKTKNIESFEQSELNSENIIAPEPIKEKPIEAPEPVKKEKKRQIYYWFANTYYFSWSNIWRLSVI